MKRFDSVHPVSAAVNLFTVIIAGMFVFDPVVSLISAVSSVCFFIICRRKIRGGDIAFYIILGLLIALFNPLVSHNGITPLFFMNGRAVTLEAVIYGGCLSLMIISTLLRCVILTDIMTSEKYIYVLSPAFPKLALTVSMTLRYIPMVIRNYRELLDAQKANGGFSEESFFERNISKIKLFFSTVTLTAEQSVETSLYMKAKGYGTCKRTPHEKKRFFTADIAVLVLTLALTAGMIILKISGAPGFAYYPAFAPPGPDAGTLAFYALWTALCFIPVITEITERIKWKYYVSKI